MRTWLAHSDPNAFTDADPNSDTDPNAFTDADADADSRSNADSNSDLNVYTPAARSAVDLSFTGGGPRKPAVDTAVHLENGNRGDAGRR